MIRNNDKVKPSEPLWLLYVEPQDPPSEQPVIDLLTRGMAAALNASEPYGDVTRGFHVCSCGAHSDNVEHKLPTGDITNSLAVHYLAYHRKELVGEQLGYVLALVRFCLDRGGLKEADPTPEQLQKPQPRPLHQVISDYHREASRKRAKPVLLQPIADDKDITCDEEYDE